MKKTASILLLSLLVFNWVGYRLLSGVMERKADLALDARIDHSDYDESTLIELRVPLNAPYLANTSGEFERYDGELEIEGSHYKYVKRKVVNGELVLLCLPDENRTRFQNSRVDFFKLVNDLNHSNPEKSKGARSLKSITADYEKENNSWLLSPETSISVKPAAARTSRIAEGYNLIPEQPPKA